MVLVILTVSRRRRSWVTRAGCRRSPRAPLQLLDRLEVEVVGGLVEHQAVDALRRKPGQDRAGALPR